MWKPPNSEDNFIHEHFKKVFPFIFFSFFDFLNIIKGSDKNSNRPLPEFRDYEFENQILEFSFITEYNFLDFRDGNNVFTPYFMGGLGVFRYNSLVPGQSGIGSFNVSIPFGIGIKYAISRNVNCTIETGTRDTFTDLIDGVSAEVEPRFPGTNHFTDDWYYYTSISFTYLFHTINCPDDAPMMREK